MIVINIRMYNMRIYGNVYMEILTSPTTQEYILWINTYIHLVHHSQCYPWLY